MGYVALGGHAVVATPRDWIIMPNCYTRMIIPAAVLKGTKNISNWIRLAVKENFCTLIQEFRFQPYRSMSKQTFPQQTFSDKNPTTAAAHSATVSGVSLHAVPVFQGVHKAAAEHFPTGGISLPAVSVFGQVVQLMHRKKKRSEDDNDGRPNKLKKLETIRDTNTNKQTQVNEEAMSWLKNLNYEGSEEEQETDFDFQNEEEKKEEKQEAEFGIPEGKQEMPLTLEEPKKKKRKEKKVAREEKEEASGEEDAKKVIDRSESFGEYGDFLIDNLELTEVAGARDFFDWLKKKNIQIRFIRATGGKGARGETFLEIKTGDHFIIIDDPAKPFTGWGDITKNTEMRILIKIYKAKSEKGYVDPIHEIVVHGMRYKPLIESIHRMKTVSNETESALLYHFYLDAGDTWAAGQHETHGEKFKEGSLKSGYPEYEPLVKEQMALMKPHGKTKGKNWAEQLKASASKDLNMQAEGKGNAEAGRSYEDNSMELLIAWLANVKLPLSQQHACEILSEPDEDWINIILLYNQYLQASAQDICKDSVIQKGLGRFKNTGSTLIGAWLKQGTSDFNIALLNHIAATGNAAGVPYDLGKRKTGTSVSQDQIIGGMQKRLLQPEIQALVNYRQALAKKMGDDSFDWEQLKEAAVKSRLRGQ